MKLETQICRRYYSADHSDSKMGCKIYHYVITSDQQTTEDPGPTMKAITNKNNVLFVCVYLTK